MPRIYTSSDLDKKLIEDVLNIDALVYADEFQGCVEDVYGRYIKNRDTYIFLYEANTLIGYFCFFPVKKEFYDRMRADNTFYDSKEISAEHIVAYERDTDFFLFAISVAIHPAYQGKGYSREMGKAFKQFINDKAEEDIFIRSVLASAVSVRGERFLLSNGFQFLKSLSHGEKLYELNIPEGMS